MGLARRAVHERVLHGTRHERAHGRVGRRGRVRLQRIRIRSSPQETGRDQQAHRREAFAADRSLVGNRRFFAARVFGLRIRLDAACHRKRARRPVRRRVPDRMGCRVLPRRGPHRHALRRRRLRVRRRHRHAHALHDPGSVCGVLLAAAPYFGPDLHHGAARPANLPPNRGKLGPREARRACPPENPPGNLDDAPVRRGARADQLRIPAAPRFLLVRRQQRIARRA